jgi:hypothetical protein
VPRMERIEGTVQQHYTPAAIPCEVIEGEDHAL